MSTTRGTQVGGTLAERAAAAELRAGAGDAPGLDARACYRAVLARDRRHDGRFFTGVLSTGIYCRPVCPARPPRFENVRFFASAAAAETAGLRACLRCRPESAPELGAWRGTAASVSRALALIEAGALDGGDVEALAARVGMGGRQLRRLFRQHLGASPVAVAQTRRVRLASQLIHQTDLGMGEVALAAGFGSVRRFNETFQALYQRPPAQLRRARKAGAQSVRSGGPDGIITLELSYREPCDWQALWAHFRLRAVPGLERAEDDAYGRTLRIGAHQGWFTLGPARAGRVLLEVSHGLLPVLARVIAAVRRQFDLGCDPEAIDAALSLDGSLAHDVTAHPGVRVPGLADPFEQAVRAILGQQVIVRAGIRLVHTLVEMTGEPLEGPQGLTRLFPRPEVLARADLSALPMPGARKAAIAALARAVCEDPALLEPGRGLDESVAALCALSGIGPWSAHYIAMRAMGEPDAFPETDVGLLRGWQRLDGQEGERPTPTQLAARAQAWRPWRAYAAQRLWLIDSRTDGDEPA